VKFKKKTVVEFDR